LKVKLYCKNGFALTNKNGYETWYINHKLHREDGPAIIYSKYGKKCWYLNNKEYSFEEWCKILNKSDEEKNLLKLKYGN